MIRPITPDGTDALMGLLDVIGLFPSHELEGLRGMLADYFAGNLGSDHFWAIDDDGGPMGVVSQLEVSNNAPNGLSSIHL